MTRSEIEEKVAKLSRDLKVYEERLTQTLAKSNDLFVQGGDGYHDNQSYELMVADVDKLSSLIEEVRQEIRQLRGTPSSS